MLVVMIEGNVFAVKIPPHYKFVPSLSIVMQAEMAILNGKVIKSRFAHEKHEEVLALLLARYKAKEYKTVLISDVNTTHCHCLKQKELIEYLKNCPPIIVPIDEASGEVYSEIHFSGVIKDISLYPTVTSSLYTHKITGFRATSVQEIEHYCERLLYNVDRWKELSAINLLTAEELARVVGEYSKYHLVNKTNFDSYTVEHDHSYEIVDWQGRMSKCEDLPALKEYLRDKIEFDLFLQDR